jgi:hypothetical protein
MPNDGIFYSEEHKEHAEPALEEYTLTSGGEGKEYISHKSTTNWSVGP